MAQNFPSHKLPEFVPETPNDIFAYSFLTAKVKFKQPFQKYDRDFTFKDSNGIETPVESFGVWDDFGPKYEKMREQVSVLYYKPPDNPRDYEDESSEYALDLCKYTEPYQIVLAVIEPNNSLSKTLKDLNERISEYSKEKGHAFFA